MGKAGAHAGIAVGTASLRRDEAARVGDRAACVGEEGGAPT